MPFVGRTLLPRRPRWHNSHPRLLLRFNTSLVVAITTRCPLAQRDTHRRLPQLD